MLLLAKSNVASLGRAARPVALTSIFSILLSLANKISSERSSYTQSGILVSLEMVDKKKINQTGRTKQEWKTTLLVVRDV